MSVGNRVWQTPEYFARAAAYELQTSVEREQRELDRLAVLRNCRVTVRLTEPEHDQLIIAAAGVGLHLSDYVRQCLNL